MAFPTSVAVKILSFGMGSGVTLTRVSDDTDTTSFMLSMLHKSKPVEENTTRVTQKEEKYNTTDSALTAATNDTIQIITASQQRANTIIETITTTSNKLLVKMYDNGVEDGDSISIMYNNRVVQHRIAVATKPVIFELLLDETLSEHNIALIAHNLGTIPPNTAMVEIQAGSKSYTISASADLQSNAVIRIIRN